MKRFEVDQNYLEIHRDNLALLILFWQLILVFLSIDIYQVSPLQAL